MTARTFFYLLLVSSIGLNCAANATTSSTQTKAPPSTQQYLHQNRGCAVIYGGKANRYYGGSNIRFDEFFYAINEGVVKTVYDTMASEKYKVHKVMLQRPQLGIDLQKIGFDLSAQVAQNSSKLQCNRVLKIFTELESEGNNKSFGFKVEMFKLNPAIGERGKANGLTIVLDGEYIRKYFYPLDEKTMNTLRISDLAKNIFGDIQKAGALDPLR